jgi:hypothetical protein
MSVSSTRVALRAAIALGLLTVVSIGCSIVSAQALGNNTPGFIKNLRDWMGAARRL